MSATDILSVEELFLTGGDKVLFKSLSFSVQYGERVGICGANGSGKTTLLRAILGSVTPRAGKVHLQGKLVHTLSAHEHGRLVGYLPQRYEQLSSITIGEFYRACWINRFGTFSDYGEQKIDALLRSMQLQTKLDTALPRLSGGELRRIFFGAALLTAPELLLLDEPFVSLDAPSREIMLSLISETLSESTERSILVVSHDREFLNEFCSSVYHVHDFGLEVVGKGAESSQLKDSEAKDSEEWIQ